MFFWRWDVGKNSGKAAEPKISAAEKVNSPNFFIYSHLLLLCRERKMEVLLLFVSRGG